MPTYRATVVNRKTGSRSYQKIEAPSESDLLAKIDTKRFSLTHWEDMTDELAGCSPATEEIKVDGSDLGRAGVVCGVVGFLFTPVSLAAIVLGALALGKSKGQSGAHAVALGVFGLLLWVVVIVAIASGR